MSRGKSTTSRTNWKPELNASELEDLIDPPDQSEIQENIHQIMKILTIAKKSRSEAYNFNPAHLNKEKRIKKLKKRIRNLKLKSESLAHENNAISKGIRTLEKAQRSEKPYAPKSKLFKKPTTQQKEHVEHFLKTFDSLNDISGLFKVLKSFNLQAEEEIKNLSKEIEPDHFNYDS